MRFPQAMTMDEVNAEFIARRLTGERGELGRLAAHMGIAAHMLSKILKGERRVQASEVPRVLSFFNETPRPPGLAEDAVPFPTPDSRRGPLIALLAPGTRTPEIFVAARDFPAFAIRSGDRMIADMARAPEPGDLAVASQIDQSDGGSSWMVCRWLPPHVQPGGISDGLIAIESGTRMVVARGVIVAIYRSEQTGPQA
jgi:hypothetical protein